MTKKKNAIGRPSIYSPRYINKLINVMRLGASVSQAAAALQISRKTLYKWAKEYKDFGDALDFGRDLSESADIILVRDIALGKIKGSPAMMSDYMRNVHGWSKGTSDTAGASTYNIQSVNILSAENRSELLEFLQQKYSEHKDIIDVQTTPFIADDNSESE